MKDKKIENVSIDFIGGKDVMPIGGFFGPHIPWPDRGLPEHITDERVAQIADMGINLIPYTPLDYEKYPELVKKLLKLCGQHGVGLFVTDNRVLERREDADLTKEVVENYIAEYKDYPAFSGMYVVDEPDTAYYFGRKNPLLISGYKKIADILQRDLGLICYSCVLAHNRNPETFDNYVKYLDEFCDTFKPKVLIYDYYVYGEGGNPKQYFWNLNNMRCHAENMNVPFWTYVQCGGQWIEPDTYGGGRNFPNEAEFQWNVNTQLAFGTKGILYFPLVQPGSFAFSDTNNTNYIKNGLIGANGKPNQWYYYAKRINQHIAAIDEVLMNAVNEGIIVNGEQVKEETGDVKYVISSGNYRELKSVEGDAMIGCFEYEDKTALYVVNYSIVSEQKITLRFDDEYKLQKTQDAKTIQMQGRQLVLDMAAGEGVLIVFE